MIQSERDMSSELRRLPSIERLLQTPEGVALVGLHGRSQVVEALRLALDAVRAGIRRGESDPQPNEVLRVTEERLDREAKPTLRRVINATGVILHTNLGRAPLSAATIRAMETVTRGYSSLELDVDAGVRGSRHEHVSALLHRLTGAPAALVVNNNASAVLLALAALTGGQGGRAEVLISRGELVEIGGGFRIPDVLRQSGADLIEVGTTNRTYTDDYAAAITERTALLLRVHASNFRIVGFVHTPDLAELVTIAHDRGVLFLDDLGSGSLFPTENYGLAHEPMVQESVQAGADLVCFSGDKLLGGPQAGILVGSEPTIARLRRHPLTRALRPDKATIAGLGATLQHYVRGDAVREVPVWRMISASLANLEQRGGAILNGCPNLIGAGRGEVRAVRAAVGGGSTPGETLESRAISLAGAGGEAQAIARRLRQGPVPIIPRVADDQVLLDLRTIQPEEDELVAAALRLL